MFSVMEINKLFYTRYLVLFVIPVSPSSLSLKIARNPTTTMIMCDYITYVALEKLGLMKYLSRETSSRRWYLFSIHSRLNIIQHTYLIPLDICAYYCYQLEANAKGSFFLPSNYRLFFKLSR